MLYYRSLELAASELSNMESTLELRAMTRPGLNPAGSRGWTAITLPQSVAPTWVRKLEVFDMQWLKLS